MLLQYILNLKWLFIFYEISNGTQRLQTSAKANAALNSVLDVIMEDLNEILILTQWNSLFALVLVLYSAWGVVFRAINPVHTTYFVGSGT